MAEPYCNQRKRFGLRFNLIAAIYNLEFCDRHLCKKSIFMKQDTQITMQLEDNDQFAAPSKKKPRAISDHKQFVESLDWQQYEDTVEACVQNAVARYKTLYGVEIAELAYQMAICTGAPSGITTIDFETKRHAQEHILKSATFFHNHQLHEAALSIETTSYNTNPADFIYKEFETYQHPDLIMLRKYSFDDDKYKNLVEVRITKSLICVRDRLLCQGLLRGLPAEKQLWVGVSSPQSWYDHVKLINLGD